MASTLTLSQNRKIRHERPVNSNPRGVTVVGKKKNHILVPLVLILIGLAVFATTVAGLKFFGDSAGANSKKDGSEVNACDYSYDLKFPLALQTKFKYLNNSINSSEFAQESAGSSRKIYIDQKLKDYFSTKTNISQDIQNLIDKAEVLPSTELVTLNTDAYADDALLITHFSKVDYRLKLLSVDGKYLFTDADYPFSVTLSEKEDASNCEAASADEFKMNTLQAAATDLGISDPTLVEMDLSKMNRMFIGGEIIPARAVDRLFLNKTDNYTFLFDRFASEMKSADLTLALLENPISGNPNPCTGCTTFVGDERNAKGFSEVGIDVLGFGNHAGDGGLKAIESTERVLKENNISFTGVSSKNLADAERLVIRDFGGKKLGFISGDDVAWFYWAGTDRWGTNRFSNRGSNGRFVVDHERIKRVISEAKGQVDYLVIMMSWGVEYTAVANSHQEEMAHAFIDNGADMIVSSHPHWVQNFEAYTPKTGPNAGKPVPIFYSLGNFVFDQTHTTETRQGIVVNAYYYGGQLMNFEIIPHLTCGYHQSSNNLADKVISGEMSYAQVDATPEKQGCIYWQPKPLDQSRGEYKQIWERFTKGLDLGI